MKYNPAVDLQKSMHLSPYDGVNPSISDSSTFAFSRGDVMTDTFEGKTEGCFLYSRHWNPTNHELSNALAAMEGTEAAWVTGSGMAAITSTILEICNSGDHIISSITVYGGTYAFFNNYLPKFNINVTFVDITDLEAVKKAVRANTRVIYTETVTNPLLQISDIPELARIAKEQGLKLVVDNTFTPMIFSPFRLGADVVVHSMTKFINGKSDCIAGAICSSKEFIGSLIDVHSGTAMLLGPVLDPLRAANIHKNLFTLHIRLQKHSENASFLAQRFKEHGLAVVYPGLEEHPGHDLMKRTMNPQFGFGGMIGIDLKTNDRANELMVAMQEKGIGYLAVSLGYFKTLFSNSGKSTSSEIPEKIQKEMGLSEGLIRFSVGLDPDIEFTWKNIRQCLEEHGFVK
jgi:methionine-gamma-lyase